MRAAAALFVLGALAGCAGSGGDSPSAPASAVLLGTYTGILPCADCAGIRTDLSLYSEQPGGEPTRYALRATYIGTRQGDRTFESGGHLTVKRGSASEPDATVYVLDSGKPDARRNFVRAGDNELRLLDREQREIKSSAPHSIFRATTVAEGDSGKLIEVRPGERLIVRLTTNRTTGYGWALLASGSDVLTRLTAGEYTEVVPTAGKPGAGGIESWYFEANRSGQQELRFVYRRPWELDAPPAKSASYTVRVR
jgi:predicted secreted protein